MQLDIKSKCIHYIASLLLELIVFKVELFRDQRKNMNTHSCSQNY